MTGFVHLHVHSHFTLLQSTVRIKGVIGAAKKLGMDAVAITDRGNLFGACEAFLEGKELAGKVKDAKKELEKAADDSAKALAEAAYAKAKAAQVKVILGCQMAMTHAMTEKVRESNQIVLLAMNATGWSNLSKLVSKSWLEGFYYEPRVDLAALETHAEGLICLTGAGRWGYLNRHIVAGALEDAAALLTRLKGIFADRLYVELCDCGPDAGFDWRGTALQAATLAKAQDIPVVATNWVHYLTADDAATHDVQLAIEGVTTLVDTKRKKLPTGEYWLKSPAAMRELWRDLPEACDNTLVIAERCSGDVIPTGQYFLPTFPCPEGKTEDDLLRDLCLEGMKTRYEGTEPPGHWERLEFELATIKGMGFPAYFLIVADFIGWAKKQGIPVGPGRGSAAGSLVAYVTGITDMCPIKYGLLFERFLNPGRKSMPDIDVDFCKDRRDEVLDYVKGKYGSAAVTNIMTLGTMKAKMAIKDVARAYEWTPEESQELANLVPADPSGKTDLPVCLGLKPKDEKKNEYAIVEAMKSRYDSDPRTRTVLDAALKLEKLGRSLGVHACGIIIAPGPVSQYVPVCRVKDKPATQFNMTQVEKCGLLKMDFLGLKTMSILKKAAQIVKETDGIDVDLLKIPLADPATFALLGTGRTLGVFQCESRGFQELIARLKPDRFEDMIALVALYRPGPLMANMHISYCDRKHGIEKVTYPHPVLENALKETYGLYIYQEQVMILSRELCGFTPAEADDLRKAMGKKDIKTLEKLKEKFINGAWDKWQFNKDVCAKMWESILGFASYCFNKSHSACYGLIAYWTAWFKANHYAAFMTANLIYEMGDKEKMTLFVEELRGQHIEVLPPDVNESGFEFTVIKKLDAPPKIRFGFGGVKAVGEGAARHIREVRQGAGPFTSLWDLCERVDLRTINKRVLEALVKVGAMDAFHPNRAALVASLERAAERGARTAKNKASAQLTLFADFAQDAAYQAQYEGYPDIPPWSMTERLRHEKELTGYWLSCHPVDVDKTVVARHATADSRKLLTIDKGNKVVIAAVIVGKRVVKTKSGKFLASLQLEDPYGRFEAVLFPGRPNRRGEQEAGAFEKYASICEPDLVALFVGTVEHRERRASRPPAGEEEGGGEGEPPVDEDAGEAAHPIEEAKPEVMPSLQISEVIPVDLASQRLTREITVALDVQGLERAVLDRLENLLKDQTRGSVPVSLAVHTPDGVGLTYALGDRWKIAPTPDLVERLGAICGSGRIMVRNRDPLMPESVGR